MHIISKKRLKDFADRHPSAKKAFKIWIDWAANAQWSCPNDVKADDKSADVIANGRMIFNVGGNKFRIVCLMGFLAKRMFVRFVGTHAEYDKIDPETV